MAKSDKVLAAMIALSSGGMPDLPGVLQSLKRVYRDTPTPGKVREREADLEFPFGGNTVKILWEKQPIPWPELKGPCATAWWWPEAAACLSRHKHHLIVAILGSSGDVKDRHARLTHLVAALIEHSDAAGVYWGNGTLVHEPQAFRAQADGLTAEHIVPQLWIDMRVESNGDGTVRFFTTGLSAFSQLEIEIERTTLDANSLLDFCYPTIDYILRSGIRIQHGETLGRSAEEKFKVTHGPSMFDSRNNVMRLSLE
jgi:Domain of unknown function (DUF4261)